MLVYASRRTPGRRCGAPRECARVGGRRSRSSRLVAARRSCSTRRCAAAPRGPTSSARRRRPRAAARAPRRPRRATTHRDAPSRAARALGLPPVPRGPVPGYVLIADRNANKLLIVSPSKQIVWQFPRPGDLRRGQSFSRPGRRLLRPGLPANRHERGVQRPGGADRRSARTGSSGATAAPASRARPRASSPIPMTRTSGPNGTITVADIKNCRVVRLDPRDTDRGEIGGAGLRARPAAALASPNGATPLPDGGMLVTEIGGWVDRLDAQGPPRVRRADPDQLSLGRAAAPERQHPRRRLQHAGPGRRDHPAGRVVWTYGPASGPGSLDRPSLAVRWPNGMIAVTDDWHHRIVVIDPQTKRIVWQYGHLGIASAAPGYLSKPDGLDLLPRSGRRPARRAAAAELARIGSLSRGRLPARRSRAPGRPDPRRRRARRRLVLDEVLAGPPGRLRTIGTPPVPTHDAAPRRCRGRGLLSAAARRSRRTRSSASTPARAARAAPASLGEPLSDLGAVAVGGRVYLVGGYTGSRYATAVLRFRPGRAAGSPRVCLPASATPVWPRSAGRSTSRAA